MSLSFSKSPSRESEQAKKRYEGREGGMTMLYNTSFSQTNINMLFSSTS